MAAKTYSENVIVLRKTRLRESDLVLTLLAEDGRQIRAVAKGALKPTGSFASRLELYSHANVLLVEGRSLDIVKEARLVNAHAPLRFDYERSVCAAPMAELLAHATQDELPVPRLFPMTETAFACLEGIQPEKARLISAAFLLKAASILGFRPSLGHCAECGSPRPAGAPWMISIPAGGVLCPECANLHDAQQISPVIVDWANALIHATFAEAANFEADAALQVELVRFAGAWIQAHIANLKSLPFMHTL